jgi:hypothetical protein
MRKHKSVVAVLLAIMMIFTFMPTMAFADTQDDYGVWNDTFTAYQPTGSATWYSVVPTRVPSASGSGMSPAAQAQNNARAQGMMQSTYGSDTAYFFDLSGAKVTANDADPAGNITLANYNALVTNGTGITINAKIQNSTDYGTKMNTGNAWTAKVTGEKIEEAFNGNKTVTLPVSFTASGSTTAGTSMNVPALLNAELTLTLNVTSSIPATITWVVDGLTSSDDDYVAPTALRYTGADHTIAVKDVEGYTAKYERFNSSSAKWETVDSITIKDVAKAGTETQYRASLVKNGTVADTEYVTPKVVKSYAPEFTWDEFDYPKGDYADGYAVADGTEYDPTSFVVAKTSRAKGAEGYNESVAAVKANKTELLAYFNDFYTVEKTVAKSNPSVEKLSIEKKNLTTAEKTALNKKYEQLLLNFNTPTADDDSAKVYLTTTTVENNIDITAVSAVTYSGKKTTKAGTLKKNKTISVKAVADSGEAVSFKLVDAPSKITINKTTGKITVKKGLKKGTYKFYVKASVKASKGWTNATEYHTIKVIVKK